MIVGDLPKYNVEGVADLSSGGEKRQASEVYECISPPWVLVKELVVHKDHHATDRWSSTPGTYLNIKYLNIQAICNQLDTQNVLNLPYTPMGRVSFAACMFGYIPTNGFSFTGSQ